MVRNQIATMASCLGPFIFYNDMQIKYRILLVIVIIIIIIKIITIIGKIRVLITPVMMPLLVRFIGDWDGKNIISNTILENNKW
jgi:hypothetical protein